MIDKNLKKKDLIRMSWISNYTLNKLNAGKSVTTDTLVKICAALHCGIDDIRARIATQSEFYPEYN